MKYKDKVAKIKLLYTELQEPLKRSVPEICSDIGIGTATFYEWKAKLKESGVDDIIEPEPGKTIFIPMRMDSKDPDVSFQFSVPFSALSCNFQVSSVFTSLFSGLVYSD